MVKSSSDDNSSQKLVSSVESSHPGIIPPVRSFVLNTNTSFAGRASDVFNRLSSLENQHSIWMANNETHESFEKDEPAVEDIPSTSKTDDTFTFKKPFLPVRRSPKKGIVSKKKNTRVWRKYSLKDTPLTTDAKNSAVAHQFLSELRKKREESTSVEKVSDDGKIMFRKPKKKNPVNSTVTSCAKVSSSTAKVGAAKTAKVEAAKTAKVEAAKTAKVEAAKTAKVETAKESKSKNIDSTIKLDHLEDDMDDESHCSML